MMEKTVNKKNIPPPTNFGRNMKFLRKSKGLTQGAFAEIIGVSRNSIASYENGIVEPNAFNFLRVCKYFDMEPQNMLELDLHISASEEFKSAEALSSYIRNSVDEFTLQTAEVSKVLEGYKEFYSMRKDLKSEGNKEFILILEDLLEILGSLIETNKTLISDVLMKPSAETQ